MVRKIDQYSSNITLIKYIMAFCVIYSHSSSITGVRIYDPISWVSNGNLNLGTFAVCIFFFISGFLNMKSISASQTMKAFFIKKIKKLLIPLIVVILITVFLIGPAVTEISIFDYFLSLQTYAYLFNCLFIPVHLLPGVFTSNPYPNSVNGSLWTMPVEVFCLLISVISEKIKFIKNKMIKIVFAYIITLFIMLNLVWFTNSYQIKAMILPVFMFGYGQFMFLIYKDEFKSFGLPLLILLGLIRFMFFRTNLILFLIILGLFVIVFGYYLKQIVKKQMLDMTYYIYLLAFPIQQIIYKTALGKFPITNSLVSFVLCLLISLFVYKLLNVKLKKL